MKNNTGGIVYSTDPNFKNPADSQESEASSPLLKQDLRVMTDKKQRAGKTVTLVTGYVGSTENMEALLKILKSRCGVGGSVKEGIIMVQGNFREKIMGILKELGYRAKQAGG